MKYLIVGLGNPGPEYDKTRHNIGFEILDELAAKHQAAWQTVRHGMMAEFRLKNKKCYLLKPSTFMNLSGKAVHYWWKEEKFQLENIFVVTDDLNLDFAKLRLRAKGSAGGHNGLTDIEDKLKTQDYARMRVGIGSNFSKGRQADFVLGKWSDKEAEIIPALRAEGAAACETFCLEGLSKAMNTYNKQVT